MDFDIHLISSDEAEEEWDGIKRRKRTFQQIKKYYLKLKKRFQRWFSFNWDTLLYYDEHYNEQHLKKKNLITFFFSFIFLFIYSKTKLCLNPISTLFSFIFPKRRKTKRERETEGKNKDYNKVLEKNKTICNKFQRCIFLDSIKENTPKKHIIEICKYYCINILYKIDCLECEQEDPNWNFKEEKQIKKTKWNFINKIKHLNEFDSDNISYMSEAKFMEQMIHPEEDKNSRCDKNKKKKLQINDYDDKFVKCYLMENNFDLKNKSNKIHPRYKNIFHLFISFIFRTFTNFYVVLLLGVFLLQQLNGLRTANYAYFLVLFCSFLFVSLLKDINIISKIKETENNISKQNFYRVTPVGLVPIPFTDIKIGDIVYLKKNEESPSDLLLIKTTNDEENVLVSSSKFDGFMDLKRKECLKLTSRLPNIYDIFTLKIKITLENPHIHPSKIYGVFILLNYKEFAKTVQKDLAYIQNVFEENFNEETDLEKEQIFNYIVENTYIEKCFHCFKFLTNHAEDYVYTHNEHILERDDTTHYQRTTFMNWKSEHTQRSTIPKNDTSFYNSSSNSIYSNSYTYNSINDSINNSNNNSINTNSTYSNVYNINYNNTYNNNYNNQQYMEHPFQTENESNQYSNLKMEQYSYPEKKHIETTTTTTTTTTKNKDLLHNPIYMEEYINFNAFRKYEEKIKMEHILWGGNKVVNANIFGLVIYIGTGKKSNMSIKMTKQKITLIEKEMKRKIQIFALLLLTASVFLCFKGKSDEDTSYIILFLRYMLLLFPCLPFLNSIYIYCTNKICLFLLQKYGNMQKIGVLNYNIIDEFANTCFLLCDKTGTLTVDQLQLKQLVFSFDQFYTERSVFYFNTFLEIVSFSLLLNESNNKRLNVLLKNRENYDIQENENVIKQIFNKIFHYSNEEIDKIFFTFLCILICNNGVLFDKETEQKGEEKGENEKGEKQKKGEQEEEEEEEEEKEKEEEEEQTIDKENTYKQFSHFYSTSLEENALVEFVHKCEMRVLSKKKNELIVGIRDFQKSRKKRENEKKLEEARIHTKMYDKCLKQHQYIQRICNNKSTINDRHSKNPWKYAHNDFSKKIEWKGTYLRKNLEGTSPYKNMRTIKENNGKHNHENWKTNKEDSFQNNFHKYSFTILDGIPFDSQKKIMCVLVSYKQKIFNFVKGSDDTIIDMLEEKEDKRRLKTTCDGLASKGFRIIVFSFKEISKDVYTKYKQNLEILTAKYQHMYQTANISSTDKYKATKYEWFSKSFNTQLKFLSIATFKEKLQPNARKCLEMFRNANIKTWIVSGDKKENVVAASYSLNLINKNDFFYYLNKNKLRILYKSRNAIISNFPSKANWITNEASVSEKNDFEQQNSFIKHSRSNVDTTLQTKRRSFAHDMVSTELNGVGTLSSKKKMMEEETEKEEDFENSNRRKGNSMEKTDIQNKNRYIENHLYEFGNVDTDTDTDIDVDLNSEYATYINAERNSRQEEYREILRTMLHDFHTTNAKGGSEKKENVEVHNNEQNVHNENNSVTNMEPQQTYINGTVYIINGDIVDHYIKYCEEEFIKALVEAKCVLLYRCTSIHKGKIVHSLKSHIHKGVCSIGNDVNDLNMLNESDISVAVNEAPNNVCNLYADITVSTFEDVAALFFTYGRQIYSQFHHISNCIYYRGFSFLFLQFAFSFFLNAREISIVPNCILISHFLIFSVSTYVSLWLSHKNAESEELQKVDEMYQSWNQNTYPLKDLFLIMGKAATEVALILLLIKYVSEQHNFQMGISATVFFTHLLHSLLLTDQFNIRIGLLYLIKLLSYILILFILKKSNLTYFFVDFKVFLLLITVSVIVNIPFCVYYTIKKHKWKNRWKTTDSLCSFSSLNSMVQFQPSSFDDTNFLFRNNKKEPSFFRKIYF